MTSLKKERRIESKVGAVRIIECRYASGLVEISAYAPPLATNLVGTWRLAGVASRDESGSKWRAYTGAQLKPTITSTIKAHAVASIVAHADAMARAS